MAAVVWIIIVTIFAIGAYSAIIYLDDDDVELFTATS
jgi:hypothetical protein